MTETFPPLMAQREAIRSLTRASEPDCVAALLSDASWPLDWQGPTHELALRLSTQLRDRPQAHGREGLVQALCRSSRCRRKKASR
jgi:hypothetical protein